MPNAATASLLVETATKCLATSAPPPSRSTSQLPRRSRVHHRLLSGEGFRGDDEQRARRIEPGQRIHQMRAIDIGDEMRPQVGALIGFQRLAHHQRPEIGAADADIDDVGDRLAGAAAPLAAADAPGKVAHMGQHGVDVGHDFAPVHHDRPVGAVAQRDMENRAVFGAVDLVAGEHAVAPAFQIGRPGQIAQQSQRFGVDALFGEIHQQVVEAETVALEPVRVHPGTARANGGPPWSGRGLRALSRPLAASGCSSGCHHRGVGESISCHALDPIPLHPDGLLRRRFCQRAEIAFPGSPESRAAHLGCTRARCCHDIRGMNLI